MTETENKPRKPSKVRPPKLYPLQELFHRIQHIRYCVLSDYDRLTIDESVPIIILTDQFQNFEQLWGLSRIKDADYSVGLSSGKVIQATIYQKGRNLFPEKFESQLLAQAYVYNNLFKVPADRDWVLARLFCSIYYEGWMLDSPFRRRMMKEYLANHIGSSIRTRYHHLNYTP